MSPRLLRPRATAALVAVDADARTYINAVRTADGGQYMESAVQRAIDAFVIGCKADGIWSAMKGTCLFMGARTLSGALTPLVGTAPTNVNFVSGDYNRKTGLVGNGTTKAINTNRTEGSDDGDSNHYAVYCSTIGTGFMLSNVTTAVTPSTSISAAAHRNRNTSASTYTPSVGLIGSARSSASEYIFRNGGSDATISRSSTSAAASNIFLYAYRTPQEADVTGTHRLAFYSIGSSLTLSLLDSRVSTLYTAIGAAIP